MIISLDTEDTGMDFFHTTRPFFVTTCDEDHGQTFWEWDVDPFSRLPRIPAGDVEEIQSILDDADRVVLHNSKFDAKALATIGVALPWDKVEDTLIAGHVLASNQPRDLTSMCLHYLGEDIQPLELELEKIVKKCRSMVQQAALKVKRGKAKKLDTKALYKNNPLARWHIAREDDPTMPSAKSDHKKVSNPWRCDYWLPQAIYQFRHTNNMVGAVPEEYDTVLRDYANADSAHTLPLWWVLERELRDRNLWAIYREQMRLPSIIQEMETRGVSISKKEALALKGRLQVESDKAARICTNIAEDMGHTLVLPKGGNNKSLTTFCFAANGLALPVVKFTEKGNPSLDKGAMELYLGTLPNKSKQLLFLQRLSAKRQRDTSISYLNSYERFWIPLWLGEGADDWYVLHPSLNQTGSDTLRFSCSNPNEQNISKIGMKCLYCAGRGCVQCDGEGVGKESVRYAFGPAQGREWWSLDAKNIELRIPFYYCGEKVLIDLFERPDDPPFYGSNHLLNFSIVYYDIWEGELGKICKVEGCKCNGKATTLETVGPHCKKKFAGSYYQWDKNGWFCVPLSTQALTRDGWKTYDQLQVGDLVLGYEDGVLKWTPVLEVILVDDAPLVKMYNHHFESVSTPDHRWIGKKRKYIKGVRQWVDTFCTTKNMNSEYTLYLSAPVQDTSTLPISDVEAAIIGFTYSDGTIERSKKGYGSSRGRNQDKVGFRVRWYQSKPQGIEWIETLLASWGKKVKKRFHKRDKGNYWDLNGKACRDIWRRAGLWDTEDFEGFVLKLGTSQRKAFLDAIFIAEGFMDTRGTTRMYGQNDGPFADAIRLAIFMNGKFPTISPIINYYGSDHTCLALRESKPYVTGQRIKKEQIPGKHKTWCVVTELDTWVMRQGDQIMLTGNCKQYGGQRELTDATFRRPGAFDMLDSRLKGLTQLNAQCMEQANRLGYVETLPDKSVDPKRGYPIMCQRSEWGKVKPTVPLSYFVQGTAMWWTRRAMVRVVNQLKEWNRKDPTWDGFMTLQVHDEIVLDLPKRGDPIKDRELEKDGKTKFRTAQSSNLWRIRILQKLMAQGGDDLGIPIPVGCEYHPNNWGEGVSL